MDNTFWATVALVIFIAAVVYFKIPGMLTKSLDERANNIRNELEEARRLREEAKQLLADFQRKREADMLLEEAKRKTEEYVARRTALAEQKIEQAEREAVIEVRASAVDIAVEAARKLLGDQADKRSGADLFAASLKEVKSNLN